MECLSLSENNESSLLFQTILSSGVFTHSIVPFLFTHPSNLADLMCVSHGFHQAVDQPTVWKALATYRYGEDIVAKTIEELNKANSSSPGIDLLKEAILNDDNSSIAVPTTRSNEACAWKYNGMFGDKYYYCMIQGLKWNRKEKVVEIYFDARGESDLRGPERSMLQVNFCVVPKRRLFEDTELFHGVQSWNSNNNNIRRAGHYQGRFDVPESFFSPGVGFTFTYSADENDYHTANLIPLSENGLQDFFELQNDTPNFTTMDHSASTTEYSNRNLFEVETPDEERNRWAQLVPIGIMNKNQGQPNAWWTVDEPPREKEDSDSDWDSDSD